MKGQLPLDYVIALLLFIVFIGFIFIQSRTYTPTYLRELRLQKWRAEAYQISEMIINDQGEPSNWESSQDVKRIGFASNSYQLNNLSMAKIRKFNTICKGFNGYANATSLIATENDFALIIRNETTVLVNCTSPNAPKALAAEIVRIVYFDDRTYGMLSLKIW